MEWVGFWWIMCVRVSSPQPKDLSKLEAPNPQNSTTSHPYSPPSPLTGRSNSRVVMYTSTAQFHRENKMDFNKWINQGIPYLDLATFELQAAQVGAGLGRLAPDLGAIAHHRSGPLSPSRPPNDDD